MDTKILLQLENEELLHKFELALDLNKANKEDVLRQLIEDYIIKSFTTATNELQGSHKNFEHENQYYAKAVKRIPRWAEKIHQNNHRILKAFFELEVLNASVTLDALQKKCSNEKGSPTTYVKEFKSNYAQMKLDTEKSHGKVFIEEMDGTVKIWGEVHEMIYKYKEYFLRN